MRTFQEIEAVRRESRITKKALYDQAGIHHSTYTRNLKRARGSPLASTLQKLDRALAALLLADAAE